MNHLLKMISVMVKHSDHAHVLVMALAKYFSAEKLRELANKLYAMAEEMLNGAKAEEPVVVVPSDSESETVVSENETVAASEDPPVPEVSAVEPPKAKGWKPPKS